ncbi:Protein N-acetyltransferase, RimJ/RimL family [Streptoalloteichus tenebrarius]|uniref:Lysine N-acyltransferase MbtK n=1 Tax=Streptoalloteichus tenebrarius (strain ATCC 17920 / DSM 40477 / JCM 4838 / CBS 697.72 / NBRC 16177 / NCIMB 11028 / NRRL B-12390 / A12253. 1 / ISP 5477) TaxID=1933 RepID=A0ABT1HX19_STRSD|nr:Protein N-acetyltransferase, RimJ/RimL family [Streptoalloteichus tenebrarius]BFF03833.1 GNAT family N-acetyltransferase [Streptoalloteichus tenebrarius]
MNTVENGDLPAADAEYSREIREGLDPAVLAVGPPPVPVLAGPWRMRLARPEGEDLDLIHGWMNAPHVAPFWDQAWPRQRWADALAGQLAGTYSRPFVVDLDGEPFAYVELYRAARDVVAAHYDARPHDVGYHVAIGDKDRIGKGIGGKLFRAVIDGVFAAEPECARIVSEPDARNEAARRMDVKLGLHFLGEVDLPHKRAALFIYPRTPADVPTPA